MLRAALAAFGFTMIFSASLASAEQRSPDVEQLMKQLRLTLIKVQGEIAQKKLPELKNIQITLQTGMKVSAGSKITFFVISIGDTVSSERTESFKLTLTPPKVTKEQVAATANFSRDFANAIIAIAESIASSSAEKPELKLSAVSASIKFVSDNKLEGGVSKVVLLPVSIDLGGSVTPTNTHEAGT